MFALGFQKFQNGRKRLLLDISSWMSRLFGAFTGLDTGVTCMTFVTLCRVTEAGKCSVAARAESFNYVRNVRSLLNIVTCCVLREF